MKNKKYAKVSVNMFENRKFKLIENMPNRDMIEIIWMKLLLEATKLNDGGLIYLEEDIPYSFEMLSVVLGRNEDDVKVALRVLNELKMIEVYENNIIKIVSFGKHQETRKNKKSKAEVIEKSEEELEVVSKKIDEEKINKEEMELVKVEDDVEKEKNNIAHIEGKELVISSIISEKKKRKNKRKGKVAEIPKADIVCDYEEEDDDTDNCFHEDEYQPPGKLVKQFYF